MLKVFVIFMCFAAIQSAPSDPILVDEGPINSFLENDSEIQTMEEFTDNEERHDFPHERGNHFEGDIILPPVTFAGGNSRRWSNRQMPYVIDSRLSSSERNIIIQAINHIHSKTCFRLTPRTSQKDYVKFAKWGGGCSSNVGVVGGEQRISLDNGCYLKSTVVHEIIHAIGFWHEQSRKDRDDYVNINLSNIASNNRHNFNKYSNTIDFGSPYDYGSIMHYSAYAFAVNRQIPTITSKRGFPINNFGRGDGNGGMAGSDAAQINRMYGC